MYKKSYFLIVVFLISVNSVVNGQTENSKKPRLSNGEREVIKLEREWLDAYENNDVKAMERIVSDDFTIIYGDGSVRRKPEIIEMLKSNTSTSASKYKTENVESRVYNGNTVILTGIVISEWVQNGEKRRDRSKYTDVYIRRNGWWQVAASQLSIDLEQPRNSQ